MIWRSATTRRATLRRPSGGARGRPPCADAAGHLGQVQAARSARASRGQRNAGEDGVAGRLLSGVWAHHANKARQILEPGDTEEALAAAAGVGDDRLQKQARGVVVPESFTHGSSEQRMRWFKRGMQSGDPGSATPSRRRQL